MSIKPITAKRAWAIVQSDLFARRVRFFQAGARWLPVLTAELLALPGGKNDDQVDAPTQGLAYRRKVVKNATGSCLLIGLY